MLDATSGGGRLVTGYNNGFVWYLFVLWMEFGLILTWRGVRIFLSLDAVDTRLPSTVQDRLGLVAWAVVNPTRDLPLDWDVLGARVGLGAA